MVIRGRGSEERELNEGSHDVQTSSYKVNKCWGVIYNTMTIVDIAQDLYVKIKRVDPEFSSHTKKFFFFLLNLYVMMNIN